MNLIELYQTILLRENVSYESVRPGKRIAVVTPLIDLDIMKVNRVGQGRARPYEELRYVAVAKICPGQSSMRLTSDGRVHLNELRQVEGLVDVYTLCTGDELGVLQSCIRAYWVELGADTIIRRISKQEMRLIQAAL